MQTNTINNNYVRFDDMLNENLKDPEFHKLYQKADEKFKIELQLNELLQTMGKTDYFVEVKNMSELN